MSAARPSAPREIRFRRLGAGARAGIAALLAGGVLLAANALSARLYAHWTYRGAAALSPETLRLLQGTTGTFEIDALFEHDHPYRTAVRDLLREYEEAARTIPSLDIRVRSIDSNRDLPETVELLRRYPVPENSVVVVHGGSYRAMDEFELAAPAAPGASAEDAGARRFDGDRAIASALLQLAHPVRSTVYFLSGHGEYDPDSVHPVNGASTIAHALRRNGYEVRTLRLSETRDVPPGVLVVADPRTVIPPREIEALASSLSRGGRMLAMVDDANGRGLGPLLEAWGVRLSPPPVPAGASSREKVAASEYVSGHPVTDPLEGTLAVFSAPFGVAPAEAAPPAADRADKPVVTPLVLVPGAPGDSGLRSVAVAAELGGADANGRRRQTRLVVFGDARFVANGLLDGGLAGNASLFLSAVNWLSGGPRPLAPQGVDAAFAPGVDPSRGWLRLGTALVVLLPLAIFVFGILLWTPLARRL